MTDKPDFSRDTGPGRPGIDNVYTLFPNAECYTTHHVEDCGCGICRSEVGYWEHDGVLLFGTEGQRTEYIWTVRGNARPPLCTVCDACLAPIVARGDLEMVQTPDGETVADLSPVARHELFAYGARSARNRYEVLRDDELPDGSDDTFVVPACEDEIRRAMEFARGLGDLQDPYVAGRIYASAALAFGLAYRDNGFDGAGALYAAEYPHSGLPLSEQREIEENAELLRHLMDTVTLDEFPPVDPE